MILNKVEIENYKQFSDRHEIEIPTVGTIGVIGNNGVGKTTLFEAIEWCLYNPSTIRSADIRPRGRGGFTKVAITLDDPQRGRRFIVERELKRTSVVATIYELDESGDERVIVQGTKPVTDHVSTQLIGLSHRAFVATFFTRQKELSFFGNLGDSDRRREVSRLLGLETIRLAQQAIAEDRKRTQSDAASYRRQYEDQSSGRDFTAETAAAQETIASRNAALLEIGRRAETAAKNVAAHEASFKAIQEVRDRDATIAQKLTEARGTQTAIQQRLNQIASDLDRITKREAERAEILPRAERHSALAEQVEQLERDRQRFLQQRELLQSIKESTQRRQDQLQTLRTTVRSVHLTEAIPGWTWSPADDGDPEAALARVQHVATTIDMQGVVEREQRLVRAREATQARIDACDKLAKYRAAQQQLNETLTRLIEAGDPAQLLPGLDKRWESLQRDLSGVQAQQAQQEQQVKQAKGLISNLNHAHFADVCPTCARPFSEHDAALVIESLRAQAATIEESIRNGTARARAIQMDFGNLQKQRASQESRSKEIADLRGRINNSLTFVDDQQSVVIIATAALQAAMQEAQLAQPPTSEQIRSARERVELYRRILETRDGLAAGERQLHLFAEHDIRLRADLAALGEVSFDEAVFKQTVADWQQADRARSSIEQIDRELIRRPELERDRTTCTNEATGIAACLEELTVARAANGFDPERLTTIQQELQSARLAERAAIDERHAAQIVVRDAHQALESLEKDQTRVAGLALSADQRQREADTLDRMYREFTEFDKYAAAHYTPILSDLTSELVREVTDGKYDRVEFDSNYGIEVFDGTEEHFSLATFSGGERDAIALCARIALSRMIGGQATSPPGFLVLDEVFGSLDRDRRTRLLDMLGALASTGDGFQQMFIISHVDDVRIAPMFDELWRVEETAEGESKIHNLLTGTEIDDL